MSEPLDLSVVIPVFNGAATIPAVVERLHTALQDRAYEIILVNDGSTDDSERACAGLVAQHPATVRLIQLARNFGEHNAVLAGLSHAQGRCIGVMDDDGQHPPHELVRLREHLERTSADVVYGVYRLKRHAWWRNLGSQFHGAVAGWLLGKPRGLYLSSFKVLSRFVVDQVAAYRGPYPYLDGLVLQTTDRFAQLEVEHQPRGGGRSNYTLVRLVRVWLNMATSRPLAALRTALGGALTCAAIGVGLLVLAPVVGGARMWPPAALCLLAAQFIGAVAAAEILGRAYAHLSGQPPYVIRYIREGEAAHD